MGSRTGTTMALFQAAYNRGPSPTAARPPYMRGTITAILMITITTMPMRTAPGSRAK